MIVGIFNIADGTLASSYTADGPNQGAYGGPWGDPLQTVHLGVSADLNVRACKLVDGQVEEDADLKAELAAADAQTKVDAVIDAALAFGTGVMKTFVRENILMGITQANMTGKVLDAMADASVAIQGASLYDFIARVKAIPDSAKDPKFVTDARLLVLVNKVETYLGLPLSTEI